MTIQYYLKSYSLTATWISSNEWSNRIGKVKSSLFLVNTQSFPKVKGNFYHSELPICHGRKPRIYYNYIILMKVMQTYLLLRDFVNISMIKKSLSLLFLRNQTTSDSYWSGARRDRCHNEPVLFNVDESLFRRLVKTLSAQFRSPLKKGLAECVWLATSMRPIQLKRTDRAILFSQSSKGGNLLLRQSRRPRTGIWCQVAMGVGHRH